MTLRMPADFHREKADHRLQDRFHLARLNSFRDAKIGVQIA
jgi:hypothetical protein